MSDIVKYVSIALARGIHQNAFAASCDDTQMPTGPDRYPQLRNDLKKEPDQMAPLPAAGGVTNLALALAMAMVLTEAPRQVKQKGNHRCLALTAATVTSSPTADAATITIDARRSCTGIGKGGRCWRQPACHSRPRRPTRTRR
jgi:hypothetical protein